MRISGRSSGNTTGPNGISTHLGCPFSTPVMQLAFLALPVIPSLRLTDRGLFDATRFEFV
ncbi:MAG: adenine deaminase C-terminal domain-containing protein [Alistipes indistinctus]